MAGKKAAGENTKKAAGNAKKAEAAAQKQAVESSKKAQVEDEEWGKGAKSNAKKWVFGSPSPSILSRLRQLCSAANNWGREAAEAKKAEDARRKAEKDAMLAEEEKNARATPKGANAKTAQKKTRGLDLSQLDDGPSSNAPSASLNATGIDNALDALSLTSNNPSEKVDRHPERRFKAAYAAYEARRLPELDEEHKGLRKQQRIDAIRKEFEKSPENPFNQVNARFDSTREEIADMKQKEREKTEARLAGK
ncbi:MAG: hypothetical protein M1827_005650 [Pycnora praestabilis]|nr:MAG: hypothetical protein M1827_005650 [Pycnora praestabilis]